jgi:hypothetical protein
LETEWEVRFNFGTPNNHTNNSANYQNLGLYIFWKYTNQDEPPTTYPITANTIANASSIGVLNSAESIGIQKLTGGAGNYNLTPDDYFRMDGWHHKHVTFNTTHPTIATLEGKYKYGHCQMDIKTIQPLDAHGGDTTAEGWTTTQATPAFPEILSIIVVQDNAMYSGTGQYVPTGMRLETEQLIQFKDLRAAYKFPTPAQSQGGVANTLNTDAAFFWRGAAYS